MLLKFLIFKYLKFDKTQPFISITAILAFLGISIGVMVLIVAMAIMDGMIKHIESKLFAMNYPLTVFAKKYGGVDNNLLNTLQSNFPNMQFSPYVKLEGAIKFGNKLNTGIIYGVDFEKEILVNDVLKKSITPSNLDSNSIILGEKLKNEYPIGLDSNVVLIFTQFQATGFSLIPSMKKFKIDGFFSSGLNAYDSSYMYVDLSKAQLIKGFDSGIYDGIHIYSTNPMEDIKALNSFLSNDASVIGWWQQNGNFFSAIALEKRALFIVLMLIIVMASLNIISSLMMVIMTRRREIALLLSLGMSKKEIKKTFFLLGNIIGSGGILFGFLLSIVVLYLLDTFPLISLPADVYGSSKLPLNLAPMDVLFVIIGSIFVVGLSSYYPSLKASNINPLNVLRNE